MSGIFDRVSGSEIQDLEYEIPYEDITAALQLAGLGLRTPVQLRDALNNEIVLGSNGQDPFLSEHAEQDLMDMLNHILAKKVSGGEAAAMAAVARIRGSFALWERKAFSATEQDCRDLSGVTFTWGA